MDCREFRDKHVAFVDDLLPAVEMTSMQRHRSICPRCSRHDTVVRRSLLIVRNLPTIEPSPEFMARLDARLRELGPAGRVDRLAPRPYLPSLGTFAALAAGVAAIAYVALDTSGAFTTATVPRLAPVVASVPEPTTTPLASAAFVASVPTGMPVWPAVLMAGEAPLHFASVQFRESR